ncbi:hypothetical protein Cgig2_006452 [Carnegiea gigantea]|uniref:EF-hand domain-containing protein n=1 Tax=Carnegiea gigantea TaxID=171969 RepID=A0A9Q1JRI1_9CARY|nr:hypothetical protein Cgig2_006452 [Carnegiea gigantea]
MPGLEIIDSSTPSTSTSNVVHSSHPVTNKVSDPLPIVGSGIASHTVSDAVPFSQPMTSLLKHTSSKLRKTFSRYDSDKDGQINPESLGDMIRTLGGNPTEAQVNEIVSKESLNGPFDFHRFVGLMRKHLRAKPMDLELHRALEAIDNDVDGYINIAKLRHAMTTMGESLDPEEFDEWIRAIGVGSDGSVRYEDIIAPMMKAT